MSSPVPRPPGLPPATSAFNDGYIAEQFERFTRDPSSVEESWRQYFRAAQRLFAGAAPAVAGAPATYSKFASARALIHAIRTYGHLAVPLDPLGTPPRGAEELTLEYHGLTEGDLRAIPGPALGFDQLETALDVVERLRQRYMTRIGYEYTHLSDSEEREWFRSVLRAQELTRPLTPEEMVAVLRRLTEVDALERFIGRSYVSAKRFSIEGTDALVPMLDLAIEESARDGSRMAAIGMAHRGRLNVLTHIMGKPYARLFAEFEGRHAVGAADSGTGDVKYHLGLRGVRKVGDTEVQLVLVPNPSHLEFVNAVVSGFARAEQRRDGQADEVSVLPIVVHGDAAFPGEGIVAETFNLSRLRGFRVGGTLHIIVNNQVGFTTDVQDARSTYYASDVAKGFEVPVLHVNADDAEACLIAVRIAIAYRSAFRKDVVIDLVGYRRHGHNEGDEPTYTQPEEYARIKAHPTARQVFADRLARENVLAADASAAMEKEVFAALEEAHRSTPRGEVTHSDAPAEHAPVAPRDPSAEAPLETAVPGERLAALNERLLAWPSDFNPHPRLAKQLERRRDAMGGDAVIDWGLAEALSFASLVSDGIPVRLTGQDSERGTFSHRHAVLHDVKTGGTYTPLSNLPQASAPFEIYNSPLSETAVMAFEYGFSVARPEALVLWEAQFGDFVNVAQPIIDQFMVADRAKWGQDSRLVLLLPHGYEGQGPEHSSARPERFLQLAAEGNLRFAYPSTPAQYFHVLRRQAHMKERRPLVLMQPKSLLRLPEAMSAVGDLSSGAFKTVISDPRAAKRLDAVSRVVFCTGKIYYDLASKPEQDHVALVRVEQLYPWPQAEIERVMDAYPSAEEVVWAQEEPKNMGYWTFVQPRLRMSVGNAGVLRYVGRPERASPAEGFLDAHKVEQGRIMSEALAPAAAKAGGARRKTAARQAT